MANDACAQKWVLVSERNPDEQGKYLTLSKSYSFEHNHHYIYDVENYAFNLSKVDEYDFPAEAGYDRPGWYWYDDEYGHIEDQQIVAWMPLPPIPEELIKMEVDE